MKPGLALAAVLCLCASAPPGWFPGAGLLVLPGWMAFYARMENSRRRLLSAYLVGVLHIAVFSYSLAPLFWLAYVPIALVGGLYYLLAVAWTTALARFVPGALAFGCALCGTTWLRCYMPGIYYPHAQPAHCLYHWPWLLGSARWGSEVLVNLLLGILAGGIVDVYRAWRLARPPFTQATWWLGGTLGVAVLLSVLPPPGHFTPGHRPLLVTAIEPGFSARYIQEMGGYRDLVAAIRRVMVEPTLEVAGPGARTPPDLVLWPESIALQGLRKGTENVLLPQLVGHDPPLRLHPGSRLLVGADLSLGAGTRLKAVALLLDSLGRYCGHHEKLWLVPGGETQPWFLRLLAPIIRRVMRIEDLPDVDPGTYQKLLYTESGTEFAALICYDNAFPDVCRTYAQRGARFFVVLSNECWYLGGAELDQMEAMTVLRALETGRPLIRCTVDGATVGVDGDGKVLGRLPGPPNARGPARVLPLEVVPAPAGGMPMATVHRWFPWLVLTTVLAWIWSLVRILATTLGRSWGRLPSRFHGAASAGA